MKYVKILGLTAVAAAALMALAATASATTLTSPTGTTYTGTIHAVVDTDAGATPPTLDGAFTTVTCKQSTVHGHIEKHGANVTASGKITSGGLTFGECNFPVTVIKPGELSIHAIEPKSGEHVTCKVEGTPDNCWGTLYSTGAEVTVNTSVGSCIFTTSNTSVGTVTGTSTTLKTATLDIGSSPIPRTGGSFLCG
ncbi:MAG TPA: hypothetical protein VN732_08360, partial [Solirubrobacterales bacterium]|nr:hypothetical protein [Solirubrobacterales bacterium]